MSKRPQERDANQSSTKRQKPLDCPVCRVSATTTPKREDVERILDSLDEPEKITCRECTIKLSGRVPLTREQFEVSVAERLEDDGEMDPFAITRFVTREETRWNSCECGTHFYCRDCCYDEDSIWCHKTWFCGCEDCRCDPLREFKEAVKDNTFVAGRSDCPTCPLYITNETKCEFEDVFDGVEAMGESYNESLARTLLCISWSRQFSEISRASGCCRRCIAFFGLDEEVVVQTVETFEERYHACETFSYHAFEGVPFDKLDQNRCQKCDFVIFDQGGVHCLCQYILTPDKPCPACCTDTDPCLMCVEEDARMPLRLLSFSDFVDKARNAPRGRLYAHVEEFAARFDAVTVSRASYVYEKDGVLISAQGRFDDEKMM